METSVLNPVSPATAFQFSEDLLKSLRGRRIAVVGNATPKTPMGEVIDSYDVVIRINNFQIENFEALVGTKTDYRCTSAWTDIDHRNEYPEFSPFTASSAESANLEQFNSINNAPVLAAQTDIHTLLPDLPKPSTGLALVRLCAHLGIPVDLFAFDGFKSAHYWETSKAFHTTHSQDEFATLLRLPGVLIFGETYPYQTLYDYCHQEHRDYDVNVGLELVRWAQKEFRDLTILEFGAGNGDLARHLEAKGNQVTAIEASQTAFDKITCTKKIHGTALSLPFLKEHFDLFLSVDVLEHLTENDIRIVIRESARRCSRMFVSVSTRPSGLLGPRGENLHLTVQPASWWINEFEKFYRVRTSSGYGVGQLILEGERKSIGNSCPVDASDISQDEYYENLFTRETKWSTPEPNDDESARWNAIETQVQKITASIAGYDPANYRILDVGCGRGWLTNLLSKFGMAEGVEPVAAVAEHAQRLFPQLKFSTGNAQTILARPDFSPYDLVVCSEVIEHVPESEKAGFVADLAGLIKPDGQLVLTTPRGEVLREWTRLDGDPSQPVEQWLTETDLEKLLASQNFKPLSCERVWFDAETRVFIPTTQTEAVRNPLAVYQVWAAQRSLESWNPAVDSSSVLKEFHLACHEAASRALVALPDHPVLFPAYINGLLELGDSTTAAQLLVRALGLHADDAGLRRLCSQVFRRLGRVEEADLQAARALELETWQAASQRKDSFSFLDRFFEGKLIGGKPAQLEIRPVTINGEFGRCIYLHPPARLRFQLPTGAAGQFTTAIAIQAEAWDKPKVGGCEFIVSVNGRKMLQKTINPTLNPSDRKWNEIQLSIPASTDEHHEFILETRAVGTPPDFRWALWRQPNFTW